MNIKSISGCWFLTGPTASGKTGLGVELAQQIRAEIISLDSMAVYRGMDIGTAKPTPQQRLAVPHHLLDILEPHEEYSLAQYLAAACRAADEIRVRGMGVAFVGGTPLYLKGALRGIFEGPPADREFRHARLAEIDQQGLPYLHQRLAAVDPVTAARLDPHDARRIIRALEVFEKTGQPISQWQQQFAVGRPARQCRVFVLDWPRDELYARIEQRVDLMFQAGLVEEVRELLFGTNSPSRTAIQAVGYREVFEHLRGEHTLPQTIDLVKLHTRQLAKRQLTWFRSMSECRFVSVSGSFDERRLAGRITEEGMAMDAEGGDAIAGP
jgi:tRNA dimethylallyltransferase